MSGYNFKIINTNGYKKDTINNTICFENFKSEGGFETYPTCMR